MKPQMLQDLSTLSNVQQKQNKPFVICVKAAVCKEFSVPEDTAVLAGFLSNAEESGVRIKLGSGRAGEVWKDAFTCESTGAVK